MSQHALIEVPPTERPPRARAGRPKGPRPSGNTTVKLRPSEREMVEQLADEYGSIANAIRAGLQLLAAEHGRDLEAAA